MEKRLARPLLLCLVTATSTASARTISQTSIGLDNTTYFSNALPSSAPTSLSTFMGRLNLVTGGDSFEAGADLGVLVFDAPVDPLPNVVETYVSIADGSGHGQFYLGRKKFDWSTLDENWKLGVWQPRFRWDYLNPELQGLTGAFYQWKSPGLQIVAFASPIYIPEQGAPIKSEQGKLISYSPWLAPPPSQFPIAPGQMAPAQYFIDVPSTDAIVAHPGGGLMVALGHDDGPWAKVSYAYKPINQLLLSAAPTVQPSGPEPQFSGAIASDTTPPSAMADVVIHPRVVYHHVGEASVGYHGDVTSGSFAILSEQPVPDSVPITWISQQVTPRFVMSPTLTWNVPRAGPEDTIFSVSYLRSWGGDAPDTGELAIPNYSFFDSADPFHNAASLSFQAPIWWKASQVVRVAAQTIYEIDEQGLLLSYNLEYQPSRVWSILVGADLLGTIGHSNDQLDNFFTRYQGNDRVHGGFRYVF